MLALKVICYNTYMKLNNIIIIRIDKATSVKHKVKMKQYSQK